MSIVIKRYANRKLYDTEKKQYITLAGIAKYIQEGEEIVVIDNTTGEDISNLTLTQIIFEKEREKSGFFPKSILAGLIKTSSETFDSIRRSLSTPVESAKHINEEIERRVNGLIEQGTVTFEEGIRLRDDLLSFGRRNLNSGVPTDPIVKKILKERGVPSKDEFQKLIDDIEELSEKINQHDDLTNEEFEEDDKN